MRNIVTEELGSTTEYQQRLLWLILLCLFSSGVVVTVLLNFEYRIAENNFTQGANNIVQSLQTQFDLNRSVIASLDGMHYAHSGELIDSELKKFIESLINNNPQIYGIEYAVKVAHAERRKFEQNLKNKNQIPYGIRQQDQQRRWQPRSPQKNYFPVIDIQPLSEGVKQVLGYDVSADPVLMYSIERAINNGVLVASPPYDLIENGRAYFLIRAVYGGGGIPDTVSKRQQRVQGLFLLLTHQQSLFGNIDFTRSDYADYNIQLQYIGTLSEQNNAVLFSRKSSGFSWLGWMFPVYQHQIASIDQYHPYSLLISKNFSLSRTAVQHLLVVLFFCLTISYLLVKLMKSLWLNSRERSQVREELFKEKERAEVTLHSIADAVITAAIDGRIEYMNTAAEKLTGWKASEALGKMARDVFDLKLEENHSYIVNPIESCLQGNLGTNLENNMLLKNKNGDVYAIYCQASPIMDSHGDINGAVVTFHDVTSERKLTQQMAYQARHDALTGLYNRREFEEQVGKIIETARYEETQAAVCYIDLDQFKIVNDTCGHIAGDALLKQLASVLKNQTRGSDVLARLGGDEFGLLLIECSIEKAESIATKIKHTISGFRFHWKDKTFEVGASIGLVEINYMSGNLSDVLSAADTACYMAKEKGRNRIYRYTVDDSDLSRKHGEMQWIHRIRQAFNEDRFFLARQKIVVTVPNAKGPTHWEVLVRMYDEDWQIVPPMAFIPAAERYDMMLSIDKWVVRNSFLTMAEQELVDEIYNINISAQSLSDPDFEAFILDNLRRYHVRPQNICFEITETAVMSNLAQALSFMNSLKELGCQFALDDFGSGLSSFSYLKNLPVNYLKIDGSLVENIINDPINFTMVESISSVGKVMGLQTIAEFVEDEETRLKLAEIGVDYAQGYGIHTPEVWCEAAGKQQAG